MDKTIKLSVIGTFIAVLLYFMGSGMAWGDSAEVKIGVLTKRGQERCLAKWSPTAKYLSAGIPGKTFVIVPLDSRQIYSAIEKGKIDFVLANPSIYVEIEHLFEASRIATLKNLRLGKAYTAYGGVVFCRADRSDIRHLTDLKGKTLMIVDDLSLAGWRAVWRELKEKGIDPYRDFKKLTLGHIHDEVVYAVRDGAADVGTVRTDTLERMQSEGKIALKNFYVIHDHGGGQERLPFLHSTREYPEWPMAKVKHTSDALAKRVAVALFEMPADSQAAEAARCAGWTTPLNYQPVHECLKELKLGPYKDLGKITHADVIRKYRFQILFVAVLFVFMTGSVVVFFNLNQKLKFSHQLLRVEVKQRKQAQIELHKNEAKYRLLVENANDAIFIAQDELIKFPNPKAQNITGYSATELTNTPITKLIHPENSDMVLDRHRRRLKGENVPATYSFRIINKSGKILEVQLNTALITWNKRPATINFLRDITLQKKLEDQVRQAQKIRSIGTLAGGIAHDFNNILFAIIGFTEILLEGALEGSRDRDNLNEILKAAKRARDLVSQILTFSRQSNPDRKPLQIQAIVKEAFEFLRSTIPTTIKFSLKIDDHCGAVMGNSTQLHQIVINLCTNAYHAVQEADGTIVVSLAEIEFGIGDILNNTGMKPGRYIRLTVSDTGHGMERDVVEQIFDPYYTTKEKGKGTGLGLSVVHGIVKEHGGEIKVYSEQGKGSTFHVFLPVIETRAETNKTEAIAPFRQGNERILLVDDEEQIVKMQNEMLELLGYHVTPRTSSIETLEAFRVQPDKFDLVITDMTMPNMNGAELASKLVEIRPDIPIIICTGFSEKMSKERADALGIKSFLMKPVFKSDLARTIRNVLDRPDRS
ncbi:MAG: hypothetical protein SRB2_00106 [Desulfobacteraceae bacterium Eth-SRB2]|nr:MAG: hypothetical protein SRB2_00106 [Desulfobacteraceae bacterium Eth-SRB2]